MTSKPELIMFDFGGVIAPEGFQLGILKLAQHFDRTFEEMYDLAGYIAGLKTGYTAGKADEDTYWKKVADLLGLDEDMKKYRYLFLDNFQPRCYMMKLIEELSDRIDLGIFSDQTNWIYELDEKYNFMKYFRYRFISWDVGFTKHDAEFYEIPSRETSIEPASMLLFDDKPRVIDRARQAGIRGRLFTSVEDCRNYLDTILR